MRTHIRNFPIPAGIFVVCLCECTMSTLYLVQHLLSFSFQLRLRLKVFFCKWHNSQVLKNSTRFSTSAFRITRCTLRPKAEMELTCHFHYIRDQLFFIAGDLFELWQTDKQLQQHVFAFRKVWQLDQTGVHGPQHAKEVKKMLRSCHQLWFLKNDTWVEHILLHFWEFRKRLGDLRHLVQMSIKSRL